MTKDTDNRKLMTDSDIDTIVEEKQTNINEIDILIAALERELAVARADRSSNYAYLDSLGVPVPVSDKETRKY